MSTEVDREPLPSLALVSPATSEADVDGYTDVFGESAALLAGA